MLFTISCILLCHLVWEFIALFLFPVNLVTISIISIAFQPFNYSIHSSSNNVSKTYSSINFTSNDWYNEFQMILSNINKRGSKQKSLGSTNMFTILYSS